MDSHEEAIKKRNARLREEEKDEVAKNSNLILAFTNYCQSLGITLANDNFSYDYSKGILATYPGLLELLEPRLIKDKEGLFSWSEVKRIFSVRPFFSGLLYTKNFIGLAHPHFRNGFHPLSNWAPRFIELFWKMEFNGCETFIALDNNRVRLNVDDNLYSEKATWYGPPFTKNIADIPDEVSKLVPPPDLTPTQIRMFFSDAYSLKVKGATKGSIKSFQVEAFQTDEVTIQLGGITHYPAKYIHAEFDLETDSFRHFDGAVHYYTDLEYFARRDQNFNYNAKHSHQIKTKSENLFKFNGKVPTDSWIEFTCQFMSQNPLMFEYFDGDYPESLLDILPAIRLMNTKRTKSE